MSQLLARPKTWVADILTLSNGVFGFLSILTWSVELGPISALDDSVVAAAYIGLGMIADGLDGIVARAWGSTGLGNALDSMSDFLTFCVAPAIFLLEVVDAAAGSMLAAATAVAAVGFIIAGMFRLARHQDGEGNGDETAFSGLPAPWSGATLVVLLLLGAPSWVPVTGAVLLGGLNVSHLRYPKTRGKLTRVALVIILAALVVIGGLVVLGPDARPVILASGAIALTMVAAGPLIHRLLTR